MRQVPLSAAEAAPGGMTPTGPAAVSSAAPVVDSGLAAEGQIVGRRYHVPRFPLDPDMAARFAAIAGDDRASGAVAHPCVVARPALCVLDTLLADPALQAERSTMLHAQSDIRWHRALLPGSEVELDATIVDAGPYGSRRGLVVAIRVAVPGGEALVDLETVLAFAPPALPVAAGRPLLEVPRRWSGGETVVASRDVAFDEGFPARYAEVSGDTNPIHLDPAAAQAAGLGGVVLHGLSTVAVGATFVVDELAGGDRGALARMQVRFARPGRPGRTARYTAYRSSTPGRFALSCRVGSSLIWRHAVVEIRS